ncbi:hypothetical protein C8R43DRAFT_159938 [Mycena crocata]|nr:hypothetical protein C8R43DRAFT_159938 [Mycena crocata]
MPTIPQEVQIFFSHKNTRKERSRSGFTQKRNESFGPVFRRVEELCRREKGSLLFSYKNRWLEDSETPLGLGMEDGDTVDCVAVIKIAILHPDAPSQFFTVNPADMALTFSSLFATYATNARIDPAHLHFSFNGERLFETESIVNSLGWNDNVFILVATPADAIVSQAEMITSSTKTPTLPLVSEYPSEAPTDPKTPETILLHLKTALLTADAAWLGSMIREWPKHYPSQDDDDIVWTFARNLMAWRDTVVHHAEAERTVPNESFLTRQMDIIHSLERLHRGWENEALAAWKARKLVKKAGPVNTRKCAIQANSTKRMLREARVISILGLIIGAWKAHIHGGLALLSNGPGLYSDLRILRECRTMTDGSQTFEKISGPRTVPARDTLSLAGDSTALGVSSALPSLAGKDEGLDDPYPNGRRERSVEEPPKRRQSARLGQNKSPMKKSPPPQVADSPRSTPLSTTRPLSATRSSTFAKPRETIPAKLLETRRAQIQHEWNKLAREAGAAAIEFMNEVDDEELPPGIGVLFPYLERNYLFDIGIAEAQPPAGCQCDGIVGCDDADECSCQAQLEDGPAYTSQVHSARISAQDLLIQVTGPLHLQHGIGSCGM